MFKSGNCINLKTDSVFYASTANARWNVEQKNKDGSWSNVTCVTDCILKDSSAANISSFILSGVLQKQDFTCVHNSAFAFCFYTTKENRNQGGYALIALTRDLPTPVFLKKLSKEKIRE